MLTYLPLLQFAFYLLQLALIAAGVVLARQHFRITKAASFMERFSHPHYVQLRDGIEGFLTEIRNLPAKEKVERFRAICKRDTPDHVSLFNRLHALGMFFGEIGVAFERGLIDGKGLRIFDRLIPYYWDELSPFVVACHIEFGYEIDPAKPPEEQALTLFSKFCYSNREMERQKLSKRALGEMSQQNLS